MPGSSLFITLKKLAAIVLNSFCYPVDISICFPEKATILTEHVDILG